MKPDPRFLNKEPEFWATVKLINQRLGYSSRGVATVPPLTEVLEEFSQLKLDIGKIYKDKALTPFGKELFDYFKYRADILNSRVRVNLMRVEEAKDLFDKLKEKYKSTRSFTLNKQKKEKRIVAYFTAIITMIIEYHLGGGTPCVYDPKQITAFTRNNFPAKSLSRRVDGSFPNEINPIAIWEIKEYYFTTTFGSRIADGVYETMLDGYELIDAKSIIKRDVFHYLMIDARLTWWSPGGIPYLCRIVDMLHMGLITEFLAGKEVVYRLPEVIKDWLSSYEKYKDEFATGPTQLTLKDPPEVTDSNDPFN